MERHTLDDILSGMNNDGFANPTHDRDNLPGVGYISTFDSTQLGRSGNLVRNVFADLNAPDPHYDVIEQNPLGDILHHRIYKP